jgi:two-component system chemotaxis response regulator CheB
VPARGASTGGPQAITQLLAALPPKIPPIVIVQHMPPVFTKHFAERLNQECPFEVNEAEDGDEMLPGRALLSPGDVRLKLVSGMGRVQVRVVQGHSSPPAGHPWTSYLPRSWARKR